jgi:hypothetical protein
MKTHVMLTQSHSQSELTCLRGPTTNLTSASLDATNKPRSLFMSHVDSSKAGTESNIPAAAVRIPHTHTRTHTHTHTRTVTHDARHTTRRVCRLCHIASHLTRNKNPVAFSKHKHLKILRNYIK